MRVYGVREGIVSVPGVIASVKRHIPPPSSLTSHSQRGGSGAPPLTSARSKAMAVLQRGNSGTNIYPISFSALSVNFSSRRLGLVLTTRERKRTIVEVVRTRDERLETGAKRLIQELRGWMASNG